MRITPPCCDTAPVNAPDELIALIPAYQEGPRIGAVVEAASRHLPVVVIDDGSRDDTAEQAAGAGATVLRQVPNAGKGAALRMGFRHALDLGCRRGRSRSTPTASTIPPRSRAFVDAFRARRPELVIGRRDFDQMPAADGCRTWPAA